jgi:hypothetical protein
MTSVMPGNRRRCSTAADNSPPRSKAVRIAAASASLTTNIPGARGRTLRPASRSGEYHAPPADALAVAIRCEKAVEPIARAAQRCLPALFGAASIGTRPLCQLSARSSHRAHLRHGENPLPDIVPSWNVAQPTRARQLCAVIPTQASATKWGLLPHWTKEPTRAQRLVNARSSTLDQ